MTTSFPVSTSAPPLSSIRDNYHRGMAADFLRAKIEPDSRLSVISAYFTVRGLGLGAAGNNRAVGDARPDPRVNRQAQTEDYRDA